MARWIRKESDPLPYTGARKNLNPLILKILANREIIGDASVDAFLIPDLLKCHSPWLMKDMEKAVGLVINAINEGKKIMAVGDYDVDGIIGAFILYSGIRRLGTDVKYRIPHRITDGYGINDTIIDEAVKGDFDLLITCDNGISAVSQIQRAVDSGMTVIITDHHDIPETVPTAHAIINPKQPDCGYPNKSLCGAGVAWKFITALYEKIGLAPDEAAKYLEYTAIATVCDIVDLKDENRIIVKNGMAMIDRTRNIGLKALIQESGLEGKPMTAYYLGYIIGPAINATGRLVHAKLALELLTCSSPERSSELAKELRRLNAERQKITEEGFKMALDDVILNEREKDDVIVEYLPDIHESIAGIVAGRLKEKFNRPVFVLTDSKDEVKGSGRSIEAYDMNMSLAACAGLLLKFGGHPMAAGFSLKKENVDYLRLCLKEQCRLTEVDFEKRLNIDLIIPTGGINKEFAVELATLEPYGRANPQPVFELNGVLLSGKSVVGKTGNVIKFKITAEDGKYFNGIYFGSRQDDLNRLIDGSVKSDVAFNLKINEFRGVETLQLTVIDFKSVIDIM